MQWFSYVTSRVCLQNVSKRIFLMFTKSVHLYPSSVQVLQNIFSNLGFIVVIAGKNIFVIIIIIIIIIHPVALQPYRALADRAAAAGQ